MKNSFNIVKLLAALMFLLGLFSFKAGGDVLCSRRGSAVHELVLSSSVQGRRPKHRKSRKAKRHAKRHGLVTHGCRGAGVIPKSHR